MAGTGFLKAGGVALFGLALAGCGGTIDRSCDDVRLYQLAAPGKTIEAPEGLDNLEEFRAIPLPKASPRQERPEGAPCLDLPPNILGTTEDIAQDQDDE